MLKLLFAVGRFLVRRYLPVLAPRLGIPAPVAKLVAAAV
jgi:hypothetical protein